MCFVQLMPVIFVPVFGVLRTFLAPYRLSLYVQYSMEQMYFRVLFLLSFAMSIRKYLWGVYCRPEAQLLDVYVERNS